MDLKVMGLRKEQELDGSKFLDFNSKESSNGKNFDLKQCLKMIDNGSNNDFKNFFNKLSSKNLLGGWWGKSFGIAPSPHVSSRRPQSIGEKKISFIEAKKTTAEAGRLFEDPDFPANDRSIFFSRKPAKPFEWKRPAEIVVNPQFVQEDYSRFDVIQGELGDCWFLAAVANLTLQPELLKKVVGTDQNFKTGYCGMFKFKFWQYGHWIEVIVDDRLPTYNGKLVFLHSRDLNEFWSALLEKAYAKLCGSYEAMKGGSTNEALEDFTGGLTELFDLKDNPPANLYDIMHKAVERNSLMAASIEADANTFETQTPGGLVRGHAYSVTAVIVVNVTTPAGKKGKFPLLRLRNPWGNEVEWKGPWSDRSPEWMCLSAEEKKSLGLIFAADGEFWISYHDFIRNFEKLEICHLDPETADLIQSDRQVKRSWKTEIFDGSWVKNATAGGCRNFLETFPYNPQYQITLKDPDEGDNEDKCTCIVALLQKYKRQTRVSGVDMLTIGFALYKIDNGKYENTVLSREFFRTHVSVARSQAFINLREVCCRFKLLPGTYIVVPSTFEPNIEGEFMLRVYSEKKLEMGPNDGSTDYIESVVSGKAVIPASPDEGKALDKIAAAFQQISGLDFEIDAWELQGILNAGFKKAFPGIKVGDFSLDTCRSMIALHDMSRSGKLDFEEFKELWNRIRVWKAVFIEHDKDQCGEMNSFELREALNEAGYKLPERVFKVLVLRYASTNGTVGFDDFIACAVKLKTMIEIYYERDPKKTGTSKFDIDAWIELTMYA